MDLLRTNLKRVGRMFNRKQEDLQRKTSESFGEEREFGASSTGKLIKDIGSISVTGEKQKVYHEMDFTSKNPIIFSDNGNIIDKLFADWETFADLFDPRDDEERLRIADVLLKLSVILGVINSSRKIEKLEEFEEYCIEAYLQLLEVRTFKQKMGFCILRVAFTQL